MIKFRDTEVEVNTESFKENMEEHTQKFLKDSMHTHTHKMVYRGVEMSLLK